MKVSIQILVVQLIFFYAAVCWPNQSGHITDVEDVYPYFKKVKKHSKDLPGSELTDAGRDVQGVYIPITKLKALNVQKLVYWIVNNLKTDAVILDVKDDRGRITFSKKLKMAPGRPHGTLRKIKKLVAELNNRGIYTIGRLVCFKDLQFTRKMKEAGIYDSRTGKLWRDRGGSTWMDPYSPIARQYIASIAKAAEDIGFDEIQLDYIRFPVEPQARFARYLLDQDKVKRHEAIAQTLAEVDNAISIPISIDVFGLTAYNKGDKDGLGQSLEHLAPHIDVISPMLYLANWPRYVWANPNPKRTHSLIRDAVKNIRKRIGSDIAVRPLLQAFKYRAANFGHSFIYNQIDAASDAGSSGYLFWNQNGRYHKVTAVWEYLKTKNR